MLDYTQEACWSPTLPPSSSRIHLSISVASHLFVSEGIHLYESGLILVLLIEQFLPLPLNKQLLPKYLPLIL
ncbi:unnamed protein product [Rotaria sp. Silwood1]|nr:unnamed protein product [Rotaria sp. Silwood1]CAF1675013.1 unnamed protein product [Rotaria sp. Silwood1]